MNRRMSLHRNLVAVALLVVGVAAGPGHAALLAGGYNIAGGHSVTSGQGGFTPPTAVNDGNWGTYWLPNSGPPITATIDLGRSYRVTDLNLYNSTQSDRWTYNYNVTISTTGAFVGEETTLVSGNMPTPAAGMTDIAIAADQFGRYVRFTGTTATYNGGINEMGVGGIPNRSVGQLPAKMNPDNTLTAKAYTRTTALTDTAASWSLSLVTPTSPSVVQSVGKTVTTSTKEFGDVSTITDGLDTAPGTATTGEVLFSQTRQPNFGFGTATVDLGQRMIIDQLSLRNTTYNGNATGNYLVQVANSLTDFDDPSYTQVLNSSFAVVGEVDTFALGTPLVGQYVRFIAQSILTPLTAPRAGLDELTVTGRTFTTSLLASGSGAVGDSSSFGSISLGSPLPSQYNLLMLDITTADGLSRQVFQQVELPEPSAALLLGFGSLVAWRTRRRAC